MTRKQSRFDFLDEVAAEPAAPTEKVRTDQIKPSTEAISPSETPYLFQPHPRTEPQAPLGNRVRLAAKHHLEDYVRDLKRAGYPATEARVLEALMLLLGEDDTTRRAVTLYLTGRTD